MKKSLVISFLSFLLVVIVSTTIILYANGYRYDFNTNRIEKTGVIRVISTPSGSDIYLNNKFEGTSPTGIANLKPGTYTIEVKKSGYLTWDSHIKVEAGSVYLLTPVLYAENIKPVRVDSEIRLQSVYFGKDRYAYTTQDPVNGINIYVHNFGTSFLQLGAATEFIANTASLDINNSYHIKNITFSPNNGNLLIQFSGLTLNDKYFVVPTNQPNIPIDLDTILDTSNFNSLGWGKDDSHILLQNDTNLLAIDITDGQKIILTQNSQQKTTLFYAPTESLIYYIQKRIALDGKTFYDFDNVQSDGSNSGALASYTSPITAVITDQNDYAYTVEDKGLIYYVPEIISNPQEIVLSGNPTPLAFSPDKKFILYKDSEGNLFTYSIETLQKYSLGVNFRSISSIKWSQNSRQLFYTSFLTGMPSTNYSLRGVSFDGSNNDLIIKGNLADSSFMLSPNESKLIIEMFNLENSSDPNNKGIYEVSIPGI